MRQHVCATCGQALVAQNAPAVQSAWLDKMRGAKVEALRARVGEAGEDHERALDVRDAVIQVSHPAVICPATCSHRITCADHAPSSTAWQQRPDDGRLPCASRAQANPARVSGEVYIEGLSRFAKGCQGGRHREGSGSC